ncbi:flavin reductase family protein [bacterium SCSIO 12696]|nr:flavin reductase family protein [bacterium SCSIO 12696]
MSSADQQRQLRNALGCFATGVTVITTSKSDGTPEGMTANSFSSVSLEPPLVLWSIAKQSSCFHSFTNAEHFAIHVLTAEQQSVSNTFASKENNKFAAVTWQADDNGTPLLEDYSARFICTMEQQHDGGDHIILVGRVEDFDCNDEPPLLFHSGGYKALKD